MKKAYKDTEEESEELYSKIISKTRVKESKEAIDRLIKKLEKEHNPGIIRSVLDYKGGDRRRKPVNEELRKYIIDKLKEKDLYDIVFPTKEVKKNLDELVKNAYNASSLDSGSGLKLLQALRRFKYGHDTKKDYEYLIEKLEDRTEKIYKEILEKAKEW